MWSDVLIPGDICSIGNNTQYGGAGGGGTGTGTGEDDVEANAGVIVPCDVLLLTGSCVVNESMLSGESTPLRKEALEIETSSEQQLRLEIDEGTSMQHKKHVLYGGTRVLQHTCSTTSKRIKIPSPPDNGCIAYVLRTGFGTTQGSLMRTILYSSQRVTANNAEAMWFILFLLCFAVIASIYVLQEGLKDASRSRFKLLLHCIMIITSVVPPELPMELSLAVTNSLIALTKRNIFCTEPFRIPFAGRIDICCFDKTGTLTSDELIMEGVVGLSNTSITTSSSSSSSSSNNNSHSQDQNRNRQEEMNIISSSNLPFETEIILAGCHSLMLVKGQIVGDPMEKAVFKEIKWKLTNQGGHLICPSSTNRHRTRHDPPQEDFSMEILHRFAFSSELKRMSTIVSILELENKNTKKKTKKIRLLSKGAPEVMEPLFQQIPTFYTKVYRHFASKGNRMIALGYRDITFSQIENIRRQEIEKDMIFAGFLMLNCPLKEDTKHIIHDLLFAQHQIMMITGDNALTACEVARQVGILDATKQQTLVCSKETVGALQWTTILKEEQEEKKKNFEFDQLKLPQLVKKYNLCMTGICLSWLYDDMMTQDKKTIKTTDTTDETSTCSRKQEEKWMHFLEKICIHIVVFARISPKQKEQILIALNRTGKITAMCGDGTNDVGALKQAHVGMSIINNPLLEQNIRSLRQSLKTDTNTNTDADADADDKESAEEAFQMVNMIGDASIASPFTSKSSSIRAIKELIRQGRCTLVTTIQMFKILGINCLVTAFYLSFLYMYGVKNGDQQLTIVGVSSYITDR
jgi:cation-transporting ATPase 13A1